MIADSIHDKDRLELIRNNNRSKLERSYALKLTSLLHYLEIAYSNYILRPLSTFRLYNHEFLLKYCFGRIFGEVFFCNKAITYTLITPMRLKRPSGCGHDMCLRNCVCSM